MQQYLTTPHQTYLLNLPYKTQQLQLLQRKTSSRIQIVLFKGLKTLKSIDDIDKKLRIIIFSLLIKFFNSYNSSNAYIFNKFKNIIYSAQYADILSNGINKQHLLKLIAQKLNSLTITPNPQMQIIKLFNCTPFFDQILIYSIKQQNSSLTQNDCQLISWFYHKFSIKILINQKIYSQNNSQLCLIGLGQQLHQDINCISQQCIHKSYKQYLCFSNITSLSNNQQFKEIYDYSIKHQILTYPMSPFNKFYSELKQFPQNQNLFLSGQSIIYSPSIDQKRDNNNGLKNSFDFQNSALFSQNNSLTFSKSQKSLQFYQSKEKNNLTTKTVLRNSREQKNSIWDLFCCT